MAIYLVDFENVHSAGLMGVEKLTEKDSVYIFYTNNSNSMNFEAYGALKATAAKVIPLFVSSGNKNALDFQLASFAGYLAGTSEDREVTIVSLDTGYVFVKNFWERTMHCTNFLIKFASSIKKCLPPESAAAQKLEPVNTAVFAPSKQKKAEEVFTVEPVGESDKSEQPENNMTVSLKNEPFKNELFSPAAENAAGNEITAEEENKAQPSEVTPINEAEVAEKLQADEAKQRKETEETSAEAAAKVMEPDSETDKTAFEAAPPPPAAKPVKTAEEKKRQSNKDKSKAILTAAGVDKKQEETIRRLVQKSSNKQQFYIGMTQAFGKDAGLAIYKSLRPEYVNLKMLM